MDKQTHHVVFGAGLIGCYLAGAIINSGLRCSAVMRDSMHRKIAQGLVLSDYRGNQAKVPPPERVGVLGPNSTKHSKQTVDVLWLTVKCTAVAESLQDLEVLVQPDTIIICCQNGLGSSQLVQQHFANNTVIRAMVPFNVVETEEQGRFHRGSEGTLAIEVADGQRQRISELVLPLRQDLLPVTLEQNMDALLWAKLQLNLSNAVNAIADRPVKEMLTDRGYRKIIAALMEELLLVVNAKDIALPKVTSLPGAWIPKVLRLPNWLFTRVANKMLAIDPKVRLSMWWDLDKDRKTEVDYLNGAVVDNAKQLGLATPLNKQLQTLIHEIEVGKRNKGMTADALAETLGLG